jgi:hypothetical protein
MSPATISLIVGLVEQLIADEPALAAEFQTLFSSGTPTPDQFAALKAKVSAESFGS